MKMSPNSSSDTPDSARSIIPALVVTIVTFLAAPAIYSFVLSLFDVSAGYFLVLPVILTARVLFGVVLEKILRIGSRSAEPHASPARGVRRVVELGVYLASSAVYAFFVFRALGIDLPLLSAFAAQAVVLSVTLTAGLIPLAGKTSQ